MNRLKECWLIVNEFLYTNKFSELAQWLLEAGKRRGISLCIRTNAEVLVEFGGRIWPEDRPEFVLFWDKDIRLARALEEAGIPVYNSAGAIEACDDKSLTHQILYKAGIPMPETILAPMTYGNIGYSNLDFLRKPAERLGFPMVVKECFGSFGQQVYLVHSMEELESCVLGIGARPMLFQRFIASSFARDIRLQVVGDQVVAAMYRYSDTGDFRANISNGGKMKPYTPDEAEKELAVTSCRALGLDFAGVDLLFGPEGKPLVCEVNSNAHFKNIFTCTGVNVADNIMEHILLERKRAQ
ncbi:RimK family alpha-L-glutamate ligase [Anaerolentibacter hominis]|uniref:ATP-grasp domain-containing protein n=1 Tax=Anaerolentibacter hominis TaxID=3079009 RepID=UPI0031B873E2